MSKSGQITSERHSYPIFMATPPRQYCHFWEGGFIIQTNKENSPCNGESCLNGEIKAREVEKKKTLESKLICIFRITERNDEWDADQCRHLATERADGFREWECQLQDASAPQASYQMVLIIHSPFLLVKLGRPAKYKKQRKLCR